MPEDYREPDFPQLTKLVSKSSGEVALDHAVQTASAVMSLHQPGVPSETINIYHKPVDQDGALGSLDLWNTYRPSKRS